jgi:hypothetical protein
MMNPPRFLAPGFWNTHWRRSRVGEALRIDPIEGTEDLRDSTEVDV